MTQATDQQTIADTVTLFFDSAETGEWARARALVTDPVDIAHGSHNETLSSNDVISGWKDAHAQFEATRYQLTLPNVELTSQDHAIARCDSHARFFLPDAQEPTTAIDGHYITNTRNLAHPRNTPRRNRSVTLRLHTDDRQSSVVCYINERS